VSFVDHDSVYRFISNKLINPKQWAGLSWNEVEGGFEKTIHPYPPGKIDILLYVGFSPFDKLVLSLFSYTQTHFIAFDNYVGWLINSNNAKVDTKPYTWTTAKVLTSIIEYRNACLKYVENNSDIIKSVSVKDSIQRVGSMILNNKDFQILCNISMIVWVLLYFAILMLLGFHDYIIGLINNSNIPALLASLVLILAVPMIIFFAFGSIKQNGKFSLVDSISKTKDLISKFKFW
jgi:hypothetical protein